MNTFWWITKAIAAAIDTVIFENVFGRMWKEVTQLHQLMKPIAVLVRNQMHHQVHVKMVEESCLTSQKQSNMKKVSQLNMEP